MMICEYYNGLLFCIALKLNYIIIILMVFVAIVVVVVVLEKRERKIITSLVT